jgi:hypothetical protein
MSCVTGPPFDSFAPGIVTHLSDHDTIRELDCELRGKQSVSSQATESNLQDLTSILERLERVERQNRTLRRSGLAIVGLIVGVLAIAQGRRLRTVEAERFVLKDQAGRTRAEVKMQPSGEPVLEFLAKDGQRESSLGSGRLILFSEGRMTQMMAEGLTISNKEGHIDLGGVAGLRLKITSTTDPVFGYASFGISSSPDHEGVVSPALTLFGKKGQGYVELDTADGPRLHMEPGLWQGNLLPGGFVDIDSNHPLIQIADQQGFTAAVGRFELKEKQTGKLVRTPTASDCPGRKGKSTLVGALRDVSN